MFRNIPITYVLYVYKLFIKIKNQFHDKIPTKYIDIISIVLFVSGLNILNTYLNHCII